MILQKITTKVWGAYTLQIHQEILSSNHAKNSIATLLFIRKKIIELSKAKIKKKINQKKFLRIGGPQITPKTNVVS